MNCRTFLKSPALASIATSLHAAGKRAPAPPAPFVVAGGEHRGQQRQRETMPLAAIAAADPGFVHVKAFNIPPQEEKLVITTAGMVRLGELLAQSHLEHR